jgi:hypothetical protein
VEVIFYNKMGNDNGNDSVGNNNGNGDGKKSRNLLDGKVHIFIKRLKNKEIKPDDMLSLGLCELEGLIEEHDGEIFNVPIFHDWDSKINDLLLEIPQIFPGFDVSCYEEKYNSIMQRVYKKSPSPVVNSKY